VTTWASGVDGRKLDDITDYITYAFIPVVFAYRFGMVQGLGILVLCVVLIFGAYGFVQKVAKTSDGFFTGFPNFWNLLILYLYLFRTPPTTTALILLFFALMIFVPVGYVSYSTKFMRPLTALMSLLYGINLALIIWNWNALDIRLVWFSLIFPLYYTVLSLFLHFKKDEYEVLFAKK
jgi:phosphatidylcholine synthase